MQKRDRQRKKEDTLQNVVKVFTQIFILLKIIEQLICALCRPLIKTYNRLYKVYLEKIYKKIEGKNRILAKFLLSVLVLIIVGIMNAYSLKNVVSSPMDPFYKTLFFKHIVYLLISSAFGVFIYKNVHYSYWGNKKLLKVLYLIVVLGLLAVLVFGDKINGARRWVNLKIISIQPSEFAKLVAILIAARWIKIQRKRKEKIRIFWIGDAPKFIQEKTNNLIKKFGYISMALFPAMILGVITYVQPDFGTAALICGFPFLMLLLSLDDMMEVVRMSYIGIFAVGFIAMRASYRMARLKVLFDPWSESRGDGYQIVQSISAVGSGHIWGYNDSLFNSGISKYAFLPECHTDFAFAVWSQEHGFLGCLVVFLAVAGIIYFGFCIAQQCRDTFGSIAAYGITLMIGLQAIYNMLMVGGFAPVVGVPLPFVSYGGSAIAMNIWGVAILASIAKDNNNKKAVREAIKEAKVKSESTLMRDEVKHRYRPDN